jgi:hypothetical protein
MALTFLPPAVLEILAPLLIQIKDQPSPTDLPAFLDAAREMADSLTSAEKMVISNYSSHKLAKPT